MMKRKALVYFQSGGPTPVINSSLYGVIKEYQLHKDVFSNLYASHYGVEGLIEGDLFDLDKEDEKEIEYLKQTPGQIIGSSRKKLPSNDDESFKKIVENIKKYNIGYILTNGGNDSMDTCKRLNDYFLENNMDVKVLGVPKTVDNDLMLTDHSIGYPSAARHIMDAAMMAKLDLINYRKGKVLIMEVMGRDSGWLTASVSLLPKDLRPDYFAIPEMRWDDKEFIESVKEIYERQKYAFIVLSEGVPLKAINHETEDSFGHKSLEGSALTAGEMISKELGISTRVILESTLQRSDSTKITLEDSKEAIESSRYAVRALLDGESGKMVGLKRRSNNPYEVEYVLLPLDVIANFTKKIPQEYLKNHQEMSEEFVSYLKPLVSETLQVTRKDGNICCSRFRFEKAKPIY